MDAETNGSGRLGRIEVARGHKQQQYLEGVIVRVRHPVGNPKRKV
jgi:hypothetical protein